MPLVMEEMGTSSMVTWGQMSFHMSRETSPWSLLTPLR